MRRLDLRDRRGGVAVMTALFGGLICLCAALAVDMGSIALSARQIQGAADLAALSAARDLVHADRAARATLTDNLGEVRDVRVSTGAWVADPAVRPRDRYSAGAAEPNAARVEVSAPAPLFFGRWIMGRPDLNVRKAAVAALPGDEPKAMFSIGSRLASLDGGIANGVLSALLGSKVSLNLMDYRGLADARVNLLAFSDALAAEIGVKAGDYDALLAHEVETGRMLKVLEAVAGDSADSALGKLTRAPAEGRLRLGDLVGVEAEARGGLRQALNADVSALDLLMASLETANGERQVALDVGARAGLADLDVMLAIGERPNRSPWLTVTRSGDPVIRTAQARVYVKATTAQALSGLAQVKLPLLVEAAASEAKLTRIDCAGAPSVTLAVRPGVARARIGAIDESRLKDFKSPVASSPAKLLSVLGLVTVKAGADLEVADKAWSTVSFSQAEIEARTMKSVRSRAFVDGLLTSLVQRLTVDVDVIGLGLGLGDLTKALGALLAPLGPVLDGVVQPLLDVLGLRLGEADVRTHAVHCPTARGRTPVLVG